jgi:hypothetical protein
MFAAVVSGALGAGLTVRAYVSIFFGDPGRAMSPSRR